MLSRKASVESGSDDIGDALDLSAARDLGKRYRLLLKIAAFNADSPEYTDTTKVWLMLSAGF